MVVFGGNRPSCIMSISMAMKNRYVDVTGNKGIAGDNVGNDRTIFSGTRSQFTQRGLHLGCQNY